MTAIDLTNTLAILDRLTDPVPPAVAAVRSALDELSHAITATGKQGDKRILLYDRNDLADLAAEALDALDELDTLLAKRSSEDR